MVHAGVFFISLITLLNIFCAGLLLQLGLETTNLNPCKYRRLLITQTFRENRKRFELWGVELPGVENK